MKNRTLYTKLFVAGVVLYLVALLLAIVALVWSGSVHASEVVAFKKGEVVTGTTKQCVYDALGSTYTITIKSYELCPLTIRVER